MQNSPDRKRLGDKHGRDGRDGRDGVDGRDGTPGPRGLRGERGTDGDPGRDLVPVPARAQFLRDDDTQRTLMIEVFEKATSALLVTLVPHYDDENFIDFADIIPA